APGPGRGALRDRGAAVLHRARDDPAHPCLRQWHALFERPDRDRARRRLPAAGRAAGVVPGGVRPRGADRAAGRPPPHLPRHRVCAPAPRLQRACGHARVPARREGRPAVSRGRSRNAGTVRGRLEARAARTARYPRRAAGIRRRRRDRPAYQRVEPAPRITAPGGNEPWGNTMTRPAFQACLVILLVLACAALSLREGRAPAPLPVVAPAGAFSATRAMAVLQRVLGDQRPHPVGSEANAEVRGRIMDEFRRIGIAAEVRSRFACGASACTTVHNILGHLPGAARDDAVLLTAHYDSVAAGPGAGDDGAGVAAVLEAARALKAGTPPGRDVWFLLDDGEEAGLLGAYAFAQEPEFADIGWVVNLEARGDVGASSLIETQAGNAGVVAAIGRALPRPSGSSL